MPGAGAGVVVYCALRPPLGLPVMIGCSSGGIVVVVVSAVRRRQTFGLALQFVGAAVNE